ncbi:MAG: S8 family serine peptidase [Gemmatimonadetes bacterium]|nr:S8 family serine peptidase [Gemmatimonadota bacterium]
MRRLAWPLVLSTAVVTACQESPLATDTEPQAPLAAARAGAQMVDVIVVLDPAFAPGGHGANRSRAADVARGFGVQPTFTYGTALYGFAGSIPEGRLRALSSDPKVLYVERDGIASIPRPGPAGLCDKNPDHPKCQPPGGEEEDPPTAQTTPWGIGRVGGPGNGTGKTAWIVDTGIDLDHPDLNVDVARSANFVASFGRGKKQKDSPEDGNGHGTHVAGTVAAINNEIDVVGVAAGASVVAVRVLDNSGSGTISGVAAGVDYVAAYVEANPSPVDVHVANMSLTGTGHWNSLHDAVVRAADLGILFALAAGNAGTDAETREPAHVEHENVYTVSAIYDSPDDCLASWSNWGNPPVDYAAPGVGVLSTKRGGGTTTMSGTSMAAPHVAGILLLGSVQSNGMANCDPDGNPDPIAHR